MTVMVAVAETWRNDMRKARPWYGKSGTRWADQAHLTGTPHQRHLHCRLGQRRRGARRAAAAAVVRGPHHCVPPPIRQSHHHRPRHFLSGHERRPNLVVRSCNERIRALETSPRQGGSWGLPLARGAAAMSPGWLTSGVVGDGGRSASASSS